MLEPTGMDDDAMSIVVDGSTDKVMNDASENLPPHLSSSRSSFLACPVVIDPHLRDLLSGFDTAREPLKFSLAHINDRATLMWSHIDQASTCDNPGP